MTQRIAYDPRKRLYAGAKLIQISIKQLMNVWVGKHTRKKLPSNADRTASTHQFLVAKRGRKREQLSVNIHQFTHHYKLVIQVAKNSWA